MSNLLPSGKVCPYETWTPKHLLQPTPKSHALLTGYAILLTRLCTAKKALPVLIIKDHWTFFVIKRKRFTENMTVKEWNKIFLWGCSGVRRGIANGSNPMPLNWEKCCRKWCYSRRLYPSQQPYQKIDKNTFHSNLYQIKIPAVMRNIRKLC